MVHENKDLGLKVTDNPREALILQAIENTKKRLVELELSRDLDQNALKFLESLIK